MEVKNVHFSLKLSFARLFSSFLVQLKTKQVSEHQYLLL